MDLNELNTLFFMSQILYYNCDIIILEGAYYGNTFGIISLRRFAGMWKTCEYIFSVTVP